jgi:hypothetical protein
VVPPARSTFDTFTESACVRALQPLISDFEAAIKKAGFAKGTAQKGLRYSRTHSGITTTIDIYTPHEFAGLDDTAHIKNFDDGINSHEIIVYNGHARIVDVLPLRADKPLDLVAAMSVVLGQRLEIDIAVFAQIGEGELPDLERRTIDRPGVRFDVAFDVDLDLAAAFDRRLVPGVLLAVDSGVLSVDKRVVGRAHWRSRTSENGQDQGQRSAHLRLQVVSGGRMCAKRLPL